MAFEVRRLGLVDQVEARLKRQLSAVHEMRTFPSERVLAHQLGVSRNTVREAISRLVAQGWVLRHPGMKSRVHTEGPVTHLDAFASLVQGVPAMQLDPRLLASLLELRRLLYGEVLRRVITEVGRQSEFAVGLLDLLDGLRYRGDVREVWQGELYVCAPVVEVESPALYAALGSVYRCLVQLPDEVLIAFPLRQMEERLVICRTLLFGDAQNAPAQMLEALKREDDALTQHVAKLRNLGTVPR